MAQASATISEDTEKLLDGVVEAGLFTGRSDAVRHALRSYLESEPELAKEIAVELYKQDKVKLVSASRLAGVSISEMNNILENKGD